MVSDESALEACSRRCAVQIDDLYLIFLLGVYIQPSKYTVSDKKGTFTFTIIMPDVAQRIDL